MRFIIFIFLLWLPNIAHAYSEEGFQQFLKTLRQDALAQGISQTTIDQSLATAQFLPKAIELDQKQPEKKISFAQYKTNILTSERIRIGREMMAKYRPLLTVFDEKYNVQPQYIVALWGIETNYGGYKGNWGIISSLATLAYEGRRHDFFKKELITALRILDEGHIALDQFRGSWAGAMGHNQFMPTSFAELAVDGNNNGKKDIWNELDDVFASTANYLSQRGWNGDEKWGRLVKLPAHFDANQIDPKTPRPLSYWHVAGVRLPNDKNIPIIQGMSAALVAPDGLAGEAYLVYDNYKVLLNWNRSTYFATTVGLLADAIAE